MAHLIYNHDVVSVEYPDSGGTTVYPIGRLKQDTLVVHNPSKDKASNAYGIDLVCLSGQARWKYITILIGNQEHLTSINYWKNHGKLIEDDRSTRKQVFLPLGLFGFDKVQKYDEYIKVRDLAELDLFEVAARGASWTDIDEWQLAQTIKEEYLASLKFKVEL